MTGDELKTLREAHGLTRETLAEMVGYSPFYLYKLEHAARLTSGPKISKRLEKQLDRLFPDRKAKKKD